MTLQQLKTFCAVYEELSFHRAAERLYISQASVSQQIAALEHEYGVVLFNRKGRSISITPEGRIIYKTVRSALDLLDAIPKKISDIHSLSKGALSIGASTLAGNYLLPPIIKCFKETFPDICLSVQTGYGSEMVQRVRDERVDLAIVGKNLGWNNDPDLNFEPIAIDRLSLIVWPGHPWANKQLIQPREIVDGYVYIHSRPGSAMRSMVEEFFRQEALYVTSVLEVGNHETIKRTVEEKAGIALISSIAIQREKATGQLVEVPVARIENVSRHFLLVSKKHHEFDYTEQAFVDILLKIIPPHLRIGHRFLNK